ncbi:hypothetical protein [uncultured Agrobacterium sp.]|uniref:hypothetical protein n=1 Tax=uncultured Agrobacterium sp. TaxID=157277 RepID=UPI00258DFFC5|nr:hypothetical protein [uncultured Agrobacterium sp.]
MKFESYAIISFSDHHRVVPANQIGGCFYISSSPIQTPFQEGISYGGGRGAFSEVSCRGDDIVVTPDFLGSRLIFTFQGQGAAIVSNSISYLISAMKLCGVPVAIDHVALGTTFVMGNLQIEDLPIKGAKLLPIASKASLARGRVTIKSQRSFSDALVSKQTLKHRAIDEVLSNVRSVAARDENPLLMEMTGGLDSRVAFAAAMGAGLRDRIDFATRGKSIEPDRLIAERVAHAFDIEMVARPYNEETVSVERLIETGQHVAGVRWLDDVAFRMIGFTSGFTALTGALGETFRNYYCEVLYYKKGLRNAYFNMPMNEEKADDFCNFFGNRLSFLADPQAAKDRLKRQLLKGRETVGQTYFRQYTGFRNRIHYGGATAARGSVFVSADPLYTISGYLLAERMDPEWQLFGELAFELIDEFFPALNSFPLAEKEVAPRFLESKAGRRSILSGKPMQGIKPRAGIPNVNKFQVVAKPHTDTGAELVERSLASGKLDGLVNSSFKEEYSRQSDNWKRWAHKSLISPAVLTELA